MNQELDHDEFLKGIIGFSGAAIAITAAPLSIYWWIRWNSGVKAKFNRNDVALSLVFLLMLSVIWLCFLDKYPLYSLDFLHPVLKKHSLNYNLVGTRMVWLWSSGLGISHLIAPLVLSFKKINLGVRTKDFGKKTKSWTAMKVAFRISTQLPIGLDVKTGELIAIDQTQRTAHVLVIGATGTGKTTLMINQILHAIKHNQPVVIIDPKGEDSTLEEIIRLGRLLTSDFDERFQLFSMSKPKNSFKYNPLKHGNANQLKDRIMEALTWSEQYYQSVAGSFLTELTAATEYLGQRLTLDRISKLLSFKEEQAALLKLLKDRFQMAPGNEHALELMNTLTQFFSKHKEDALSGLSAQISILNNPTFGGLLSFDLADNEIDFRDSRKNGKIAYFQLDTLGNADSARRLGRMVIEDLKSLASEVYKTEPNSSQRPFFPVFIDEFGSFATREFIEFLKQSRGANFAIHLFCQGLEDLDTVSPEFRRQVISNTMTKIGMRMDDHETVNEICATAGTFDALEQSYQVEGSLMVTKTGMGNMRHTKQMQIEHDVFKQLRTGEAVVIQKSPNRVSGIRVCLAQEMV